MKDMILIVEDMPFTRNMIKDTLGRAGYSNIFEVSTAADALAFLSGNQPALIILDITLPDCPDLSLLKTIMSKYPESQVIINSAVTQQLMIDEAKNIGAREYFKKPYDEEKFITVVRAIIGT